MARLIWRAPAGVAYTQFNKLRGFAHMLQMHRRLSKFIQFRQTRWLSDSVTLHSGIYSEAMIPRKVLEETKIQTSLGTKPFSHSQAHSPSLNRSRFQF